MAFGNYPPYIPVGERKAKALKKVRQLKKKNRNINPILIEGTKLANTWWGLSWNRNLERYADFSNRIGRGKSYVRHGAVLDLQITPGCVNALVQGSRSAPYRVEIKIKPLKKVTWQIIKKACVGKLDSLQTLSSGKFPRDLAEVFLAQGTGLFPTPDEIELDCSCPDWAVMCKHVAAVLYGVGVRLDDDPGLFFLLRQTDMNELVSEAVEDKTSTLLANAKKKSKRVIEDQDLSEVFGIVMEEKSGSEAEQKPARKTGRIKPSTEKSCTKAKRAPATSKKRGIRQTKRKSPVPDVNHPPSSELRDILNDLRMAQEELADAEHTLTKLR